MKDQNRNAAGKRPEQNDHMQKERICERLYIFSAPRRQIQKLRFRRI